jgi:hypothetical protein
MRPGSTYQNDQPRSLAVELSDLSPSSRAMRMSAWEHYSPEGYRTFGCGWYIRGSTGPPLILSTGY